MQAVTVPELGALLVTLANYGYKKGLKHHAALRAAEAVTTEHVQKLDALKASVDAMTTKVEKVEKVQIQSEAAKAFAKQINPPLSVR